MNRRVAQERAGSGGFPRGVLWGEAGGRGREEASAGSAVPTSP